MDVAYLLTDIRNVTRIRINMRRKIGEILMKNNGLNCVFEAKLLNHLIIKLTMFEFRINAYPNEFKGCRN